MPYMSHTTEHRAKITASARKTRFDKIADPLWKAIHRGHNQEIARLQDELRQLIEKQKHP